MTIMGLQTLCTIAPSHIRYDKEDFNKYTSSILFLSTLSFILMSGIILILKKPISIALNMSVGLLIILLIQSFGAYIQSFYNMYLIQTKKPFQSLVLSLSYSILTIVLSLILVLNMENNRYLGKIAGGAIITCLFGFFLYFIVMKNGKKIISIKYWKYCLTLALPVVFSSLSCLILGKSDRVM
ncbi:MAG: oligosaccharide flippase family protein, partial [Eubacterium sp.]